MKKICSYLKDRRHVVILKDTGPDNVVRTINSTESSPINTGVPPQSSKLGPILFLLYVNHLPESVTEQDLLLLSDDVSHTISGYIVGWMYDKRPRLVGGHGALVEHK